MMHIYYSPIFRESVLCTAKGARNITLSAQSCMHINIIRNGLYLFFGCTKEDLWDFSGDNIKKYIKFYVNCKLSKLVKDQETRYIVLLFFNMRKKL